MNQIESIFIKYQISDKYIYSNPYLHFVDDTQLSKAYQNENLY